jgi:hypothetical protein
MANRYWVGGTGTWDGTAGTKWAATSGGAGGQTAPASGDLVFFDAASGANTVTLGISPTVGYLIFTGFTGTFAFGTNKITLDAPGANQFTGTSTMTVTGTPVIDINNNTSGTVGITGSGTITEANSISFNVISGTGACTVNTNVKNLNFTGFAGSLNNSSRSIYGNLIISTGMTLAAGANATTFLNSLGTQQITTNGKTLDFPLAMSGTGILALQDNLTMGSTRTFTLNSGTLDLTGNSGNWTLTIGNWSSVNSNTRSILFGTGSINVANSGTSVFSMSTATGFTYTGTPNVNFTYSGSTGTRTITFGSTGGAETNAFNFNVNAGSDIVVFSARIKNLNFTGFSGTLGASSIVSFGNYIISSGMSTAGGGSTTFSTTSGTQQITTANKTLDFPLTFNGVGGTFAFQDALTQGSTRAFTITNGTVQLKNGVTSTVGSFVANNSSLKFLQSTTPGSQATLSQASGTVNVVDLTIRDINAVGGASWNAYTDFENTDAGNNDGWNFSLSPPYSTAELPITLRPFTQPRRF